MPSRSASSPAFSGELQKMRYCGFSDVAGALLFAGGAGLLGSPASAQAQASKNMTSPVTGNAVPLHFREWTGNERSRSACTKPLLPPCNRLPLILTMAILLAAVCICRNCVRLYCPPTDDPPRLV